MAQKSDLKTIVVFDFDGTLTNSDSFIQFVKAAVGYRIFCYGILLNLPRLIGYKLGIINNGKAKEALFGYYFRNMSITDFYEYGNRFVSTINRILRHDTMAHLLSHIQSGHDVYIVTASMPQWIKPWANTIGIKDVIGTEPEIYPNGVLSGKFATPNCYGTEKYRRFLAVEPNRSSYYLIAYGDSAGDSNILAEADEPHWV